MIYLLFNEGYSASGGDAHVRVPLCEEAIRLGRLLLRLFPSESEIMGLTALMLLQHARAAARLDENANIVLLDDQDRSKWNHGLIAEGLVLVEKAQRRASRALISCRPLSPRSMRAPRARRTPTGPRSIRSTRSSKLATVTGHHTQPRRRRLQGPWRRGGAARCSRRWRSRWEAIFIISAVKGALLKELGRTDEAREAFNQAISLARTAAEAAHIRMNLDKLNS